MASLSNAPFDESIDSNLFNVSFGRIGKLFLKTNEFKRENKEAQFGVLKQDGEEVKEIQTWRGVYIFATRISAILESEIAYVGKGCNLSIRLSNYAIILNGVKEPKRDVQEARIRNELCKAINDPNIYDVSLWLANCSSGSPCYTALENRLLQGLKKSWNKAPDDSSAGCCSWCAIKSLLDKSYLNSEASLTTIANKPKSDIGMQLDKPRKVCSRYPALCHCLDCTFSRVQDAFKNESVIDCARSRKMRREIDKFIAVNKYEAFFNKD